MKRKKMKAAAAKPSILKRFDNLPTDKKRRTLLKGAGGLAAIGFSAVALSSWDQGQKQLHDLSVIG